MFEGADGLATRALGDIGVDEQSFKDTIGIVYILGLGALIGEGETPLGIMVEEGVDISPRPSPELDITKLKGTPIPGELNG